LGKIPSAPKSNLNQNHKTVTKGTSHPEGNHTTTHTKKEEENKREQKTS
jgi:hypothetical protein